LQKIEKIAYSRNGKDTPNIQIGITSFLYKISTRILRVGLWWDFGVGDFKYVILNFKAAKGVSMATKFGQK